MAKVGGCEKFIEGQKVIILTRVTSNTPSSGQRNSDGHWHVLKYPVVVRSHVTYLHIHRSDFLCRKARSSCWHTHNQY